MAQADNDIQNFTGLRLNTDPDSHYFPSSGDASTAGDGVPDYQALQSRPPFRGSAASQDTIRAISTPPMDIPTATDSPAIVDDQTNTSTYIDHYMRRRKVSVSFADSSNPGSGLGRGPDLGPDPVHGKDGHFHPPKTLANDSDRTRGRSLLQTMSDAKHNLRGHSESESTHYDPITGRHLPKYSHSPPREHPRVGEARFPLLQRTVDDMARESQTDLSQSMSLTSASTMSPNEQPITPRDEDNFLCSPAITSPTSAQAFSFDEPRSFRRTASQRWREGESSASPQDFFSRAGSLRNRSLRDMASRPARQNTSTSTRSPKSAASSYLRSFSISAGMNSNGDSSETGPPAVDSEGQTIGDDYVLGKQIGYGGFSVVKEVTQFKDGQQRKLAVKIVRRRIEGKSEAENDQTQAEFEHEVDLWRFLNHPNILPVEAVYKLDEATFCFIPLNVGGTLFDLVRANRTGLAPETAKIYAYQLALALRYLHLDARVVHRDIKLENCLVEPTPDGKPGLLRVCDFGMAEWLSNDGLSSPPSPSLHDSDRPPQKHIGPADTSTSAFTGGSLEYAAPEIIRLASEIEDSMPAERSIVSPAVDLWAYGVCVYSMIVGSRPFQNAFQPRVVMAILAGDWDCTKLIEKGGDDVHELVQNCLEMEDARRWDIQQVYDSTWLQDCVQEEKSRHHDATGWRL